MAVRRPCCSHPARLLPSRAFCWSLPGAGLSGIMKSLPNGLSSLVSSGKGGASGLTFLTHQPSTPGSYHHDAQQQALGREPGLAPEFAECLWVTRGPALPDSHWGLGRWTYTIWAEQRRPGVNHHLSRRRPLPTLLPLSSERWRSSAALLGTLTPKLGTWSPWADRYFKKREENPSFPASPIYCGVSITNHK